MLKEFLNNRGVVTSHVLRRSETNAYELPVSQYKAVKKALGRIFPFLCKKARAALGYFEGKITGNQLIAILDAEVEANRRERKVRTVVLDVPYTRPEGDKIMEKIRKDRLRGAFGRYRARLRLEDFRDIRVKHRPRQGNL